MITFRLSRNHLSGDPMVQIDRDGALYATINARDTEITVTSKFIVEILESELRTEVPSLRAIRQIVLKTGSP